MSEETVAGRVLVANMLEVANQDYPTSQAFRRRLAELYGMTLSTSVSKRGMVHFVDVTVSYVRDEYVKEKLSLTEQVLQILHSVLFRPLIGKKAFDRQLFEIEKKNLLSYLETEVEDHFYHADVELNRLFFNDDDLKIPRVATARLVEEETAESTFEAFQNMLKRDKIDIIVVGKVDEAVFKDYFSNWKLSYRKPKLQFDYQQDFSNITREKIEQKDSHQSVLELAYHLQVVYNDVNYPALLVFNNLFGNDSHSRLFMKIREREGLAYTIGSSIHIFSGFLRVYAGIHKENRLKTMQLIRQQMREVKTGRFTEEELFLAKKMLIQSVTIAQDRPVTLMEEIYHQKVYKESQPTFTEWIKKIESVERKDVIKVAQLIKLQAVYFMEGADL